MEIMVAKINDEYLSKYCEKCVVDKSGEDSLVVDGSGYALLNRGEGE